jgi:hypothetical protein
MDVKEIPAVGVSITANLNGDRQIVLQTHFAGDATAAEKNAAVDGLNAVVDRAKAKYEIVDLEAKLADLSKAAAQFDEDYARIEADYWAAVERRKIERETYAADRSKAEADGYDAFKASGRAGAYAPKGHVKASLDRYDAAIKALDGLDQKAQAERDAAVQNLDISRKRFADEIVRVQGEIAKRRELADG